MHTRSNAMQYPSPYGEADIASRAWAKPAQRARNTFFKLFYRWTHSRAFRHNERLAHGVRISRDSAGRLTGMSVGGRAVECVNTLPFDAPHPAGCHLIATGPSINQIDYRALPMRRVMGVNGAIALQERKGVRFDYYCIVDGGFVRNRPDLVARVIAEPLTLYATPLVLWYIAQRFDLRRMRCRVFLIDNLMLPAGRRALTGAALRAEHDSSALALFDGTQSLGFSLDIRRGVLDGCTVAYAALQVLAAHGFTRIFLHGVDMSDAAHTPRFYESSGDMQPSYLDSHFHAFIEPSFRHASALLRSRRVQVVNLSMQSALGEDIFPKLPWQALVQETPPREPAFA